MKVRFKKLVEGAKMPIKAHKDDFAYDCYAVSCEEVAPNVYKYGLGFALQIDRSNWSFPDEDSVCAGFTLRPRSSVWKTGMVLSNSVGTIDEGYTGEISAVFYHVMPNMPKYEVGDRVCQIHVEGNNTIDFCDVETLESTDRGAGGYGSSGK